MATKTGELRETLIEAIAAVKSGKMPADDATAISKLAAQVNASLKVEIDAREQGINNKSEVGTLSLGDESA